MRRTILLAMAVALVVAPQANGVSGGKVAFSQKNDIGRVSVQTKYKGKFRYMVVDGLVRAWTDDGASRRAHFSLITSPPAKKTLVMGPGAGAAVEAALFHGAENVDVMMENPLVVKAVEKMNTRYAKAFKDSRTNITYSDPDDWLDKAGQGYDMIFLWPSVFKPQEIASQLHVKSMERVKGKLAKGGTATLWIPLGFYNPNQVKSIMADFTQVFPVATVWVTELTPDLGWAVVIGSTEPRVIEMEAAQKKLAKVAGAYRIIEEENLASFLSFYVTGAEEIRQVASQGASKAGTATRPSMAKLPGWKDVANISRTNYKFFMRLRQPVTSGTDATGDAANRLESYFTARTSMIEGRLARKTKEGRNEIGHYDEALKLAPDDPCLADLYKTLGKSYLMANMPVKAVGLLEKSKKINPNHAATRYYLGKAYEKMTRYELATPEFKKLRELEPNFIETISEIGQ